MTRVQAELEYLYKERSDIWIARETGIPRATIGYVRRGERELPPDYSAVLRNAYQREAYGRLREEGMSWSQARRYSWYAPESVSLKESEMHLLVDKYTTGAVTAKIRKLQREGFSYNEDELWNETRQEMIGALQRSKLPVEELDDY